MQEIVETRKLKPPTDARSIMLPEDNEHVTRWLAKASRRTHKALYTK